MTLIFKICRIINSRLYYVVLKICDAFLFILLFWLLVLNVGLPFQKYDLDPAAKAAAATVLASKLGADSGLKVFVGDETARSSDAKPSQTTGLRNRKQSHARSNIAGAISQSSSEISNELEADGEEISADTQKVVEHYKGTSSSDGGWLARLAAILVGEDPSQSYALICGNCHMHNGRFNSILIACLYFQIKLRNVT